MSLICLILHLYPFCKTDASKCNVTFFVSDARVKVGSVLDDDEGAVVHHHFHFRGSGKLDLSSHHRDLYIRRPGNAIIR